MEHTKAIKNTLHLTPFVFVLLYLSSLLVVTIPVTHTVEIRQMQFTPAELTVNKGDKVVFVNKDIVTHDVTEASGKLWQSPALTSGKSWSMVITRSQAYYCSYHPVMKGKILIR
ncbi:plastocyanin/azurin family copper-binding protein [Pontibacter sp. H259]|uniref:plastocyanin/azurin family copper-binding protein n=1 Tax=Pontibacter sp. H259 TaxID=3133421 RepID=UPI0030BB90BA